MSTLLIETDFAYDLNDALTQAINDLSLGLDSERFDELVNDATHAVCRLVDEAAAEIGL